MTNNRQELFDPHPVFVGAVTWWTVDWRIPIPLSIKCNPLWLLGNDWDPDPPDWSWPAAPMWLRRVNWWLRNPFHNLGRYVLGVGDQNYRFHYKPGTRDNRGELIGWETSVIELANGHTLPFVAYGSDKFVFYAGWQSNGFAGFKLNKWALLAAPLAPFLFLALVIRRMF